MANIKLLQEAIQAFANGDSEVADRKMRKYFVETAQEINKKLSEEMDSEEEEMCEDVDTGEADDMEEDVGYKLNEEEDLEEGMFGGDISGNSVNIGGGLGEADEDPTDDAGEDFGGDEGHAAGGAPDADQWEEIKDAFDALERMFDEIESGDADLGDDDFSDEEEGDEGEFGDVDFGDEHMGESFQMKKVSEPEKSEKAGVNKKSVVAKNAKSPVEGVKPVTIKDGSVDATDDKFENSDAMSVKVEDNNNVMDNGKHVMKPAKTPTNTAEKSKSVLPKQK